LLRGGGGIGVGTGRTGKVGERRGKGRRGLQTESGVGPSQNQLRVQSLRVEKNRTAIHEQADADKCSGGIGGAAGAF